MEEWLMAIIITDNDVRRYMPIKDCIEAMHTAFADFSKGQAHSPPRVRYISETEDPNRKYWSNVHAGAVPSLGMACVRAGSHVISFDPDAVSGRARSYPDSKNWSVIILYDLSTAEPIAFMHESYLSGMRVAATSGAVVNSVSRETVTTLGLFGAGRQARAHVLAICAVRPSISTVMLYSPTADHCQKFAAEMHVDGVKIIPCNYPREAVDGCDIICAATASSRPVFDGKWLQDGQMVISIANSDKNLKRYEVDSQVLQSAETILINDWHSVEENEQIELTDLVFSDKVPRNRVIEIGDLFAQKRRVRQKKTEIVYYKNNSGLGIQFAAAGAVIYNKVKHLDNRKKIPPDWLGAEAYSQGTN